MCACASVFVGSTVFTLMPCLNHGTQKRFGSSSDHAGASLDNSWSVLGPKGTSEARNRAEAIQSLALGQSNFWLDFMVDFMVGLVADLGCEGGDGRVLAWRHQFTVERIYSSIARVGG